MAQDPGLGYRVVATVKEVRGQCNAGHKEGDSFEISCHNPSELCGFFYHNMFPSLYAFQFGANPSWWKDETIEVKCPDLHNLVTVKLERTPRE